MVLKTLSLEPMHGWGISQRIQQISRDVFQINQGSLYPALQRMLSRGVIKAEWRISENNRRARYYMLTTEGKRELARERAQWERASTAVNWVLDFSGAGA
jgi:transcriptional regulator